MPKPAGRPRKPTALKLIEGRTKHIPKNHKEPQPTETTPVKPEWVTLDAVADAEWERVVPELASMRLLTCIDGAALEIYVKSYSRMREAETFMDKAKTTFTKASATSGYLMPLPQVAIAQKYAKICMEIMREFGMTPSSRGRMSLPSDADAADDDMALLFAKKK
jgi:P27 family predicted phage terminase small subunit